MTTDADDALRRLKDGNRRFVDETPNLDASASLRSRLVAGQAPFATIIGCSDSRVPTEIIFDQGLGDLFVVRVAGNVVQPSQIGSVEFAAQKFGVQLVVVLGHTHCGAIEATLGALRNPDSKPSKNLQAVVDCIQPAFENLLSNTSDTEILQRAVRENVLHACRTLQRSSTVIEALTADDKLRIVGAEYDLETGVVEFFSE